MDLFQQEFDFWLSGRLSSPAKSPFKCFDIFTFDVNGGPLSSSFGCSDVEEAHLGEWLRKQPPPGHNGGLRLIFFQHGKGPETPSMQNATITAIGQSFKLHPRYLEAFIECHYFDAHSETHEPPMKHFAFMSSNCRLVLSYHLGEGVTCAMMYNLQSVGSGPALEQTLERLASSSNQALLIAVVLAEASVHLATRDWGFFRCQLIQIESRTKHVPYESGQPINLSAATLSELSINLAKVRSELSYEKTECAVIRNFSQGALQNLSHLPKARRGRISGSEDGALQEKLTLIMALNEHNANEIAWDCQRAEMQRDIIYNLLAREDSALNARIAEYSSDIALATKRDSDSMKTMAALTMAFLPGTWVAALFAMPLFNWSAEPGEAVINQRFWIYWAIVLPLTILVLLMWWSWKEWRKKRDVAQEALARSYFQSDKAVRSTRVP